MLFRTNFFCRQKNAAFFCLIYFLFFSVIYTRADRKIRLFSANLLFYFFVQPTMDLVYPSPTKKKRSSSYFSRQFPKKRSTCQFSIEYPKKRSSSTFSQKFPPKKKGAHPHFPVNYIKKRSSCPFSQFPKKKKVLIHIFPKIPLKKGPHPDFPENFL